MTGSRGWGPAGSTRPPARRVVRAPNHLGDLVMALPALEALDGADVLVPRGLAGLLAMVPRGGRVLPFDRSLRGQAGAVRAVRRGRYEEGVLLTPSFSSALLFLLAGVPRRVGSATDGRAALLTEALPSSRGVGLHRSAEYLGLATGVLPDAVPVPRLQVPAAARERWATLAGGAGEGGGAPLVGLLPVGTAPARRWDPARYGDLARRLLAAGCRVVVFGGPDERAIAAELAPPAALNVVGRTDLPLLAAGLASCDLVVGNDCGPLHVARAVGVPTLSVWGAGDPRIAGHTTPGHRILQRTDLPCVPCFAVECPRKGAGYQLPTAERECLRLIEVATVEAAIHEHFSGSNL